MDLVARKCLMAKFFVEFEEINHQHDFKTSDIGQPFHYRIDECMLHAEPAYLSVADVTINWKGKEFEEVQNKLFKALGSQETGQLGQDGNVYQCGIFNFILVSKDDETADYEWVYGKHAKCRGCEDWNERRKHLQTPLNTKGKKYLVPLHFDEKRGFEFKGAFENISWVPIETNP